MRDVGLKLILTRSCPRRIMALGDAHALMTKEYRDALERDPRKQELDCKSIAEAVCVAARNSRKLEETL